MDKEEAVKRLKLELVNKKIINGKELTKNDEAFIKEQCPKKSLGRYKAEVIKNTLLEKAKKQGGKLSEEDQQKLRNCELFFEESFWTQNFNRKTFNNVFGKYADAQARARREAIIYEQDPSKALILLQRSQNRALAMLIENPGFGARKTGALHLTSNTDRTRLVRIEAYEPYVKIIQDYGSYEEKLAAAKLLGTDIVGLLSSAFKYSDKPESEIEKDFKDVFTGRNAADAQGCYSFYGGYVETKHGCNFGDPGFKSLNKCLDNEKAELEERIKELKAGEPSKIIAASKEILGE